METKENINTMIKNLWDRGKVVLRGKFTVVCLPEETRKFSNIIPRENRNCKAKF